MVSQPQVILRPRPQGRGTWRLGRRTYVTPEFPAGQSPSAPGNAAFQGFPLLDLTRGSCVSALGSSKQREPGSPASFLLHEQGWTSAAWRRQRGGVAPHCVLPERLLNCARG